ncbi:transcriptional regulator [Sinosporangium siamense]|uniref:Transcriptional regulator n=1 Tax=Sinosporangium siamense TaxID=1367973 RepID=A0A919VAZ5_9ACTN|nr:transcriptional regulator [Sinosporangium siamense]
MGALAVLVWQRSRPGLNRWIATHTPAYRRRLAGDPFAARLVEAAFQPHYLPDFMTPPPAPGEVTFHDEIRKVQETPAATAAADLEECLGRSLPKALLVPDLPERVAGLLEWVWNETVQPYWARRRRVLEADIVARTQQLGTGGWAAALEGIRPGLRWLGDGRLQVNAHANPAREVGGAQVLVIPTTSGGWIGWDLPHRYAIVYSCSGLLATPPAPEPALGRLLGPIRAEILTLLETPLSTTQITALTGHSLGSVGGHLKILHDAGLVWRRRSGRSVLYCQTAAGRQVVEAAGSGMPST